MSERKSSEQWRELYDSQQESGCSKAAFCRMHNLNYHQFLYWSDTFTKKVKKLIPVEVYPTGESLASIRLSNGALLEISSLAALRFIVNSAL